MSRPLHTTLTRRAFLRLGGGAIGLAGIGLLAACGTTAPTPQVGAALTTTATSALAAPTTAAPTTAAPAAPATLAPTAASAAAAIQPTAPPAASPSAAPFAVTATLPPSAVVATAPLPPLDVLAQGRTTDGFPFLGSADAPVTLIDYSDFLLTDLPPLRVNG